MARMMITLLVFDFCCNVASVWNLTYMAPNNLTCYLCQPGTFFVKDCSADHQRAVCSPCPAGTFIPNYNRARDCQPCSTVCPNTNYETAVEQREITTADCSSTADIKCECRPEFWREGGDHGMCRRVKECEEGYGVTTIATSNSDTICERCEDGQTFSNTSSAYDACMPCTECHGHMYVKHPCERDRDTVCIPLTSTELPTSQKDSWQLNLGLVISITLVSVLAVGVIIGVCCLFRRRRNRRKYNYALDNRPILNSVVNEVKNQSADKSCSTSQVSSQGSTRRSRSDLPPSSSSASIHTISQPPALNGVQNISSRSPPFSVTTGRSSLKKEYDDTLTQLMMDIYRQNMESVGAIIRFAQAVGTGFRVGEKYIATAMHVITDIIDPRRCGEQNLFKLKEATIVFTNSPHDPSARHYNFNTEFYYHDDVLDVAILEIANADELMPRKLTLRKEPLIRVDAETVSLIGYGHPGNPNKHFENRCQVVHSDSQAISTAHDIFHQQLPTFKAGLLKKYSPSVVEKGYQGYDAPHTLLMHCFMEHGASGSPILACVNPSAGIVEVVGVLISGIPEFYFCLDEQFKCHLPNNCRFEVGSRMSSIYERMTNKRINIVADLFV